MPTIIRHALVQKVAASRTLHVFQQDFYLLTGLQLDFISTASDSAGSVPPTPMCQMLHADDSGKRLCARTIHQLCDRAKNRPESVMCDAGLQEALIPVFVSGISVGFLRFAGFRMDEVTGRNVRRTEHLLRRAGVSVDRLALADYLVNAKVVSPPLLEAYLRMVAIGAQHLALEMTAQLAQPADALPDCVEQAVKLIRKRALVENLSLSIVARECGFSPSHLSRAFHHATGLTFREYMARFRAEHAENLILGTRRSITEIALDSGFQSLSQFNRVFRQVYGKSPRQLRAEQRSREKPAVL